MSINNLYLFTGGFILIFILGNFVSHLCYKRKHESLLKLFKGKDYILIRNTEISIEASGKPPYKNHMNKADVIFSGEYLLLVIRSQIFVQALPVLQISRIGNYEKFPYVWEELGYISKMKVKDQLRITGFSMRGPFRINYKIFINIKNAGFDLENDLKKDL
ncbi:hypothetical protein [Chryseobacterium hagamense]|uniref:Uncharacterized protein n=1 Tax=Chryseobacterium hagamense TaxID=395935 RepID=A0A511YHE0_9FLAO|nr:hypothetical protein [Chryseobacterium hagamense]GEN74598.1 hypothetical protein CHA01nite_03380 [Chryseobacterium hagamense]